MKADPVRERGARAARRREVRARRARPTRVGFIRSPPLFFYDPCPRTYVGARTREGLHSHPSPSSDPRPVGARALARSLARALHFAPSEAPFFTGLLFGEVLFAERASFCGVIFPVLFARSFFAGRFFFCEPFPPSIDHTQAQSRLSVIQSGVRSMSFAFASRSFPPFLE